MSGAGSQPAAAFQAAHDPPIAQRFLLSSAGHFVLLLIFFWWAGLSDANKATVALSIAVAILWLAAFLVLQRRIFAGARWAEAIRSPRFWGAIVLFIATIVIARMLVYWIPNVPGLAWQLISAFLRFGLAWTLLNAAWCGIAWQATLPPAENRLAPVA
jgi:hypothetical protein